MKKEIYFNYNLNSEFQTEWLPTSIRGFKEPVFKIKSIQLAWLNVSGIKDGSLKLLLSNDEAKYTIKEIIEINSADNSNDVVIIDIDTGAEFIGFQFCRNNIIGGKIEIIAIYERSNYAVY